MEVTKIHIITRVITFQLFEVCVFLKFNLLTMILLVNVYTLPKSLIIYNLLFYYRL